MSVPLSAADVLGEHVAFELECIDRVYCNAYVRRLTYPGGVASLFTRHRGASFASTCLADPISKQFVASFCSGSPDRRQKPRRSSSASPSSCKRISSWSCPRQRRCKTLVVCAPCHADIHREPNALAA